MEGPAREMNLSDVAQRVEKIIVEAGYISQRIDEATDTLRGHRGKDAASNGAPCPPEPSGLVPLLSTRLAVLEAIQGEQRDLINRLQRCLGVDTEAAK